MLFSVDKDGFIFLLYVAVVAIVAAGYNGRNSNKTLRTAAGSEDAENIHMVLNKNLTLSPVPVIYFTHTRGIWVESEKVYACRKTRCT